VLLAGMAPLLVASLAVPGAFGKDALVFGVAFFCVRALHILAYAVLARDDPALRRVVFRLARTIIPAAGVPCSPACCPERCVRCAGLRR
jgi:low temperature requirement protein LtrA